MNLPYSDLSSPQQAQVAALFHDDVFGASSEDYLYEVAAATGLLTGQRSPVKLERPKMKGRKLTRIHIMSAGPLILSDQAARFFAIRIIESTVSAPLVHAGAG